MNKIKPTKEDSNPGFGIICPKCNRNNCTMNAQGEPSIIHLESGTETGIKLHIQYICNDCGYTKVYTY